MDGRRTKGLEPMGSERIAALVERLHPGAPLNQRRRWAVTLKGRPIVHWWRAGSEAYQSECGLVRANVRAVKGGEKCQVCLGRARRFGRG